MVEHKQSFEMSCGDSGQSARNCKVRQVWQRGCSGEDGGTCDVERVGKTGCSGKVREVGTHCRIKSATDTEIIPLKAYPIKI